jgi:hypothetical protein
MGDPRVFCREDWGAILTVEKGVDRVATGEGGEGLEARQTGRRREWVG